MNLFKKTQISENAKKCFKINYKRGKALLPILFFRSEDLCKFVFFAVLVVNMNSFVRTSLEFARTVWTGEISSIKVLDLDVVGSGLTIGTFFATQGAKEPARILVKTDQLLNLLLVLC
jgi:hypothetical protein